MRRSRTTTVLVALHGITCILWILTAQPARAEERPSGSMQPGSSARDQPRPIDTVDAIDTIDAIDGSDANPSVRAASAVLPTSDVASSQRLIAPTATPLPRYAPPRRGAPIALAAGGSRHGARALPTATALAPRHVAQTLAAQPSVFWHIDALPAGGTRIRFVLIDEDSIDPLIEQDLPLPVAAGIQRLRLTQFGAGLAPGHDYEWSISLANPADSSAPSQVTVGYIRRVAREASAADAEASADDYAARGLWYDALEAVSDEVAADPGNPAPRRRRNALLRQGQLEAALEVAE